MKQYWNPFIAPSSAHTESIYQQLIQRYSESHRHYHTLTHIQRMFAAWEPFQAQLDDPVSVAWAIWFHDVIYKPLRKDNEEKSAEFARNTLQQLAAPQAQIAEVEKMILASANHMHPPQAASNDLLFFLDIDLLILGSHREEYQEYTQQIRKEYRQVPGFMYRSGRKKVVQAFLGAPQIFKTPPFFQTYEQPAKENLQWEWEQF